MTPSNANPKYAKGWSVYQFNGLSKVNLEMAIAEKEVIYQTGQRVLDLRHHRKESLVIIWNTQTLAFSCKMSGIN